MHVSPTLTPPSSTHRPSTLSAFTLQARVGPIVFIYSFVAIIIFVMLQARPMLLAMHTALGRYCEYKSYTHIVHNYMMPALFHAPRLAFLNSESLLCSMCCSGRKCSVKLGRTGKSVLQTAKNTFRKTLSPSSTRQKQCMNKSLLIQKYSLWYLSANIPSCC